MFAGFNIEIDKTFFDGLGEDFVYYKKQGKNHLANFKAIYEDNLKSYILNETVDGSKLQNDWFPEVDADIFISHSHIDKDLAEALAGWINDTFKLNCFIDSDVWGYADNLLEELNKNYSNKREKDDGTYLYDHKSSNKVSQHVNTMLSIALQKMIDKTEAIFLLNTSNSVKITDSPDTIDKTYSPWIYSEIVCSEIVRKKPLFVYRNYKNLYTPVNESCTEYRVLFMSALTVSYTVSLKHLIKINKGSLRRWQANYKYDVESKDYPLDTLYLFTYPSEVEKAKSVFEKISPSDVEIITSYYNKGVLENENVINEKVNFACESEMSQHNQICGICKGGKCPYHDKKD